MNIPCRICLLIMLSGMICGCVQSASKIEESTGTTLEDTIVPQKPDSVQILAQFVEQQIKERNSETLRKLFPLDVPLTIDFSSGLTYLDVKMGRLEIFFDRLRSSDEDLHIDSVYQYLPQDSLEDWRCAPISRIVCTDNVQ